MFGLPAREIGVVAVAWCLILLSSVVHVSRRYDSFYAKSDAEAYRLARTFPVRDLVNDAKVQAYLKQHPVYVSVSTTPSRIAKLPEVLATLALDNVTKIWVVVPQKFRQATTYTIPKSLRQLSKVALLRIDKDLGPISKSLPVIAYAQQHDPGAIIITIDDDYFYPRGLVNEHIYRIVHGHKCVSGSVFASLGPADTKAPVHYRVDDATLRAPGAMGLRWLVQGVGSIGFIARDVALDRLYDVVDFVASHPDNACFFADDVVMSYIFKRSGLAPSLLANQYLSHSLLRPFWANQVADAVSNMALSGEYLVSSFRRSTDNNALRVARCLRILRDFERTNIGVK